jgi:hypothetical protein
MSGWGLHSCFAGKIRHYPQGRSELSGWKGRGVSLQIEGLAIETEGRAWGQWKPWGIPGLVIGQTRVERSLGVQSLEGEV